MDEVEQDGTAPGLTAPAAAAVEVVVGLMEQGGAGHRDNRSEPTAMHDLAGLGHDWAVVAVMSGQHRHTRLLARLDEPPGPSTVSPIGFSTITGTPAATHSSPPSTWIWLGVARMTPSGSSRSNSSASD